jgi:hypothetical protein
MTKKKCLLCREDGGGGCATSIKTNKLPADQKLSQLNPYHEEVNNKKRKSTTSTTTTDRKVFGLWAENCVVSISRLLKIPKSHPFRHFLLNAAYCPSCVQLIRDVDFSLRQIDRLQQQVLGLREDLLSKLGDNYSKIPNLQNITVKLEDVDTPKRRRSKFVFDEVVKLIFESKREPFAFS